MGLSPRLDDLRNAVSRLDVELAAAVVNDLITQIQEHDPAITEEVQKIAFDELRKPRWFALARQLGEQLVAAGSATHRARRQYAQALIEQRAYDEALSVLRALVADGSTPAVERAEGGGLIGRVSKQLYVDKLGVLGAARYDVLKAAISAYYETFQSDRKGCGWQGINAVALILRSQRDGTPISVGEDVLEMAREISENARQSHYHWDLAIQAEAQLALKNCAEARALIAEYVRHPEVDSFSCASTLRQLREIWQLTESDECGEMVTLLQHAVLRAKTGDTGVRAPLTLDVGKLESAREQTDARRLILERTFSGVGPRPVQWVKMGLERARAVGRIERLTGEPQGTGFLVKESALFMDAAAEQLLLVTNAHVLGMTDSESVRPADALVRFEDLDLQRAYRVKEVLFESPTDALDTTIVRLEGAVAGVQPFELAPHEEPTLRADREFFVIGYPFGAGLTLSIQDNRQVGWLRPKLHYRTPTEPGSSGSPVFDDAWRLIAIHRAGSRSMPRLDGQSGTYEANEGVWIHAIRDAIAQQKRPLTDVRESAPSPIQPCFRQNIFVSYAHADARWRELLQMQLKPALRGADIRWWDDQQIAVGSNWLATIERELDTASAAVLLVSANFLNSEFIHSTEFPKLLTAAQERGLALIPVFVGACNYQWTELAKLQFANDPSKPLNVLNRGKRDQALAKVADKIVATLGVARLLNPLAVIDAVAFQDTGFGGTAALSDGTAALGALAEQRNGDLVIKARSGQHKIVPWSEIDALDAESQQFITANDKAIRDLYGQWTEAFSKRADRDPGVRSHAVAQLDGIRQDLCGVFGELLDFFEEQRWDLDDHYKAVRYICKRPR